MPYIRSANPSRFEALDSPGPVTNYRHGAEGRDGFIPLAFQVTSPYDRLRALMPHSLIAHVNPQNFSETFNKKIERIQTRGGFVEQHWGDDLGEISVDQSTGAFLNIRTGLSSVLRHKTIAWDRYRDLYDLYRNNGSVYDPFGNIVLQGHIMVLYDRGTYLGYFRSFSVEEVEETPFAFKLSWTFKVTDMIYQIPVNSQQYPIRPAAFQRQNSTVQGDVTVSETRGQVASANQAAFEEQLVQQNAANAGAVVEPSGPGPTDEEIIQAIKGNPGKKKPLPTRS